MQLSNFNFIFSKSAVIFIFLIKSFFLLTLHIFFILIQSISFFSLSLSLSPFVPAFQAFLWLHSKSTASIAKKTLHTYVTFYFDHFDFFFYGKKQRKKKKEHNIFNLNISFFLSFKLFKNANDRKKLLQGVFFFRIWFRILFVLSPSLITIYFPPFLESHKKSN